MTTSSMSMITLRAHRGQAVPIVGERDLEVAQAVHGDRYLALGP